MKKITFEGNQLTFAGREINLGDAAPNFRVVSQDMNEKTLEDFKGKVKVIASFPSLDTPVCDLQVKEFNKRASGLGKDVVIIGISKDLPFAQKRFCSANEIKDSEVLSDYRYSSFGANYGLLIKEWNLLGRSVWVVDKSDVVRYRQVVGEVTEQPDYEGAIKALEEVIKNPGSKKPSGQKKCVPCQAGTPPMEKAEIDGMLSKINGWKLTEDGKKIRKELKFEDFRESEFFFNVLAEIAEEEGHHPDVKIVWNKVTVTLTTHAAKGLTENDFIMAGIIDGM